MLKFEDAIPRTYTFKEYEFDGVHVTVHRNPNADPEIRMQRLQEVTNILYRLHCNRMAQKME